MRVELSSFVEGDLATIADYIAQDNPSRAVSFLAEIRVKLHAVGSHPLHYRLRPEIGPDARAAVVGRFLILFRVADGIVRIERVVYGGRALLAILAPEMFDTE